MKKIIPMTLFILSFSLQASALNYQPIVGEYKLVKSNKGDCTPALNIVIQDFLNQRTLHSLSLYGNDSKIIYQLTGLNAQADFHKSINPMTNLIDGTFYDVETLSENKISAMTVTKNNQGIIQWKTTLSAYFAETSFNFTKTEYNNLSGRVVTKIDDCEYSR